MHCLSIQLNLLNAYCTHTYAYIRVGRREGNKTLCLSAQRVYLRTYLCSLLLRCAPHNALTCGLTTLIVVCDVHALTLTGSSREGMYGCFRAIALPTELPCRHLREQLKWLLYTRSEVYYRTVWGLKAFIYADWMLAKWQTNQFLL